MIKNKILLVEDEADIVFILRTAFKSEGCVVLSATSAEAGLKLARKHKPDLIVSDIMLPKMDGLEMVRLLRRESDVPVLFLTARRHEFDRVLGLELGADDYISKPFSVRELLSRVKAVLRRTARPRAGAGPIRVGGIEIDADRHEVRVHGKVRRVTPRELQLLILLAKAGGKVLSREHLLERIWGYDESMEISTRTVDQHVARLRRALLSEKRRLATVKNSGYALKIDPR